MKVLMVCLGNICRSPLAHGIMDHLIADYDLSWTVDSAGTAGYHEGELPDERSIAEAQRHGLDITDQRSRKLTVDDFYSFDLIIAMDAQNYQNIIRLKPSDSNTKVEMMLNYSFPNENRQVPDPYYDGGFDLVYKMLYKACESLINSYTT